MDALINQLFNKYLEGKCTPQEKEMLLDYFQLAANESLLKALILQELRVTQAPKSLVPDLSNRLNRVYQNVSVFMDEHTAKTLPWWRGWRSIAAAVLVVGLATLYLLNATVHDVNPGKNAATLILANGEKIILSDVGNGSIAKQSGVTITKTANGQLVYEIASDAAQPGNGAVAYNTLSTANGEQYKVVLPDGSSVILNAASFIKFPTSFARLSERKIELGGEAFFSVKHNAKQPFRVLAQGQIVEDIGTKFNISAYADDREVTTTLAEGSARITLANNASPQLASRNDGIVLTPGQQSGLTIAAENVSVKLSDYIGLTSFTHHPYYGTFAMEVPDNYNSNMFYNLPLNELISSVKQAIHKGYTIAWDADVSNNGFKENKGYAK